MEDEFGYPGTARLMIKDVSLYEAKQYKDCLLYTSPIHFGIMMIMNLGIGNITPPVGSALFSGCSVAGIDMEDMIKPILPFYGAIFAALMLVAYVPWFSMVIPTLVGAV